MEAVILFLLKAAASGTAGHYTKKLLEKVDYDVGSLFAKGASPKQIEEVIEKKNLAAQVNDVFQKSIEQSIIIPTDLSIGATPDDLVQTLQAIVSLGFSIAYREKFDVVLPGSPWSPDSLSIFECPVTSEQHVRVHDRTVSWDLFKADLYILPMPQAEIQVYWQSYLKSVRTLRASSKDRVLKMKHHIAVPAGFDARFKVKKLTGASVVYDEIDRVSATLSGIKDAPIEDLDYVDWHNGMLGMISGVAQIEDLKYLPTEEWEKLKDIIGKLNKALSL